MANDFSGDTDCLALYKFDNNPNDSQGSAHLTDQNGPGYISTAGEFMEGTHSVDYKDNANESSLLTDALCPAGFPAKNGVGNADFSVCFWVKFDESTGTNWILGKQDRPTAVTEAGWWFLTSSLWPIFGVANGTGEDYVGYGTQMTSTQWYHFGATYNASTKELRFRIWDETAGDHLNSSVPTQTTTGTYGLDDNTVDFEVGTLNGDDTNDHDGHIDELVIFTDILTDAEIDEIRAQTYTGGVSALTINVSDSLSFAEALD
jgi:hypothetical protein